MTRAEYEHFLNTEDKRIEANVTFTQRPQHPSILASGSLKIDNPLRIDATLEIHYNPDADSKVFSIVVADVGPVCRLCVDNTPHRQLGRSHKHRLGTPECPKQNLRDHVEDRPDLAGRGVEELFQTFCELARIQHIGTFTAPVLPPAPVPPGA